MFIPNPESKKKQKKTGVKKICCPSFFCSHKNHKIENYINFELVKKKIWGNLQIFLELSTQKIVIRLSKIWGWDPGSGKNLLKKAPAPGSGSATLHIQFVEISTTHIP